MIVRGRRGRTVMTDRMGRRRRNHHHRTGRQVSKEKTLKIGRERQFILPEEFFLQKKSSFFIYALDICIKSG
jgi:hypothetical protein